ncbi:MAG TPA: enoyl-CoA hydratase [Candidatus Acidoferrales bacterium]|nr:enoyl-CoA hydratase [Candidatus Acidoferrales bacterium]
MPEQPICTNIQDRVATLTLNRPDKLNALSRELLDQSIATLRGWAEDPQIGVVVITGAGRAFCAGGDIGGMSQANAAPQPLEERINGLRHAHELSWLLYSMPKPTIAAVNGHAMGAGLSLCLAADLRIASDSAKFGTAYSKIAFGGDFGITWLLTRYAGPAKAKELLFFADAFDAAEAMRIGLLNRVVPHESLAAETAAFARRLAEGPLVSFRYQKENVNLASTADFRTMLDRESETHLRCGQTEDHKEGVRAFLEKRPPKFSGK